MIVSSKDNELVKRVKKLNEKKYRDEYGEFIIEGTRMINEALEENAKIKKVLISENFDNQDVLDKIKNQEVALVSSHIFESISNVNTPQGILAIVSKPEYTVDDIDYDSENFLLLDNLQDPGNLGTIMRTADSLDASPKCSKLFSAACTKKQRKILMSISTLPILSMRQRNFRRRTAASSRPCGAATCSANSI